MVNNLMQIFFLLRLLFSKIRMTSSMTAAIQVAEPLFLLFFT